jgi:Xaa-Pro aminopeptidase
VNGRVDRLRERLEEPLLVSDPANVRYLCGLVSSNAALFVEPERIRLYTDFRYAQTASELHGVEFVDAKRDLFQTLSEQLAGTIGFEARSLSFEHYSRLHAGGIEPVPRYDLVEGLRAVKDEDELDAIRRAAEITNTAFERFADEADIVGRTERELAWRFEQLLHEANADGVAFAVTMASGLNSAKPHTELTDRVVVAGEPLLVDAGCMVDGYCSDCTRTFATGSLPDELKHAYEVCLDAELAALEAVRPGASGPGVDSAARDRIAAAGLGDAFGHGLGHGVGLVVHEAPRLAQESRSVLEAGNVVTVEPGIYLSGLGGIRIEDLVVVTDGEPEILTTFPKDLRTLD